MNHPPSQRDSHPARVSSRARSSPRGRALQTHRTPAAAATTRITATLESIVVRTTAPLAVASSISEVGEERKLARYSEVKLGGLDDDDDSFGDMPPLMPPVTSSSSEDDENRNRAGFSEYKAEEEEEDDDDSYGDMPPLIATHIDTPLFSRPTTRARVQRRPSSSQLLSRRSARAAASSARAPTDTDVTSSGARGRPSPSSARSSSRSAPSTATSSASSTAARKPTAERKQAPASSSSSRKRAATASAVHSPAASPAPAQPTAKRARSGPKPPPNAKNDADYDDQEPSNAAEKGTSGDVSCCICMSEPEIHEVSTISGCEHRFCFGCIAKWSERENTCPLCKVRFTKIIRLNPQKASRGSKAGGPRVANSKTVKQRDQRSDILSGPTLEGLLHSLAASAAGGPSQNMLDPFMRRLLNSGFITGGAGATRSFSLADLMNDSEDDDDADFEDESDMFHPFSFLMRASTGHYRGPFPPSFPTVAVLSMPTSAAGASSESSRTVPVADRASRQHSAARMTIRTSNAPPRFSRSTASQSPPSATPSGSSRFAAVATAAAATARPSRSYATNSGDSRAGQNLSNPLEIDDSSDDEVQVISVNYPTSPAFM